MGAETMLWASDATWVAMLLDEGYLDLHWTWVKDLHRSWSPLMTETIPRPCSGTSDVAVGESALHAGSVLVMTVIERGGSRP